MDWPTLSADLNPIELLWNELKRNVRKMQPTNKQHLWKYIYTCRNQIRKTDRADADNMTVIHIHNI